MEEEAKQGKLKTNNSPRQMEKEKRENKTVMKYSIPGSQKLNEYTHMHTYTYLHSGGWVHE